jgi:hypothetical protein
MTMARATIWRATMAALAVLAAMLTSAMRSSPVPRGTAEARQRLDALRKAIESPEHVLSIKGYQQAVPLVQAVADFNRRFAGVGNALREDEVIAAILCWTPDADGATTPSLLEEKYSNEIMAAFRHIAEERTMPVGSILEASDVCLPCVAGEHVRSQVILLRIGLHRYPADVQGVPAFTRLVRRSYWLTTPPKKPVEPPPSSPRN